jgi:hypothetical protein
MAKTAITRVVMNIFSGMRKMNRTIIKNRFRQSGNFPSALHYTG